MEPNSIDPVLLGRVLERLNVQDREIEALRSDVRHLLDLASQGKGGLLMLTTVGTFVGSVIGWVAGHLWK